jgi:hypothetical protein
MYRKTRERRARRQDTLKCGWHVEGRMHESGPFAELANVTTRDDADVLASHWLNLVHSFDLTDAQVRITPLKPEDMNVEWTGPTGHTLTLMWHQTGGDLYIFYPDGERFHKHYEWWQQKEAQDDAFLFAEALKLTATQAA